MDSRKLVTMWQEDDACRVVFFLSLYLYLDVLAKEI